MEPFGARLKQERERRGITLDEIALSTKIGTRLLRALEEEHFDQLPGGIFNKGFVRAYAHHLGLDEDQAVADYLTAAGISASPPLESFPLQVTPENSPQPPESRSEIIPWGWFAVVLMVIAFGFAVWGFYSREAQKSGRKNASAEPASRASAAVQNSATSQEATPVAASGAESTPAGSIASGTFSILIKAREDSWLSITADGSPVMEDTLAAESEKLIEAHKQIVVKAGNVGGLDFWFNGQKLPSQGDFSQVKTLTFAANGLETGQAAASPQP